MAFSDHMKVMLGVDAKGFTSGLQKAEKKAQGFGNMMKSKVLPMLGAAAFARTATSVINFAAQIGDLSKRLGVSSEFLQKFQFAAEQSGVKSEGASIALQRFARRTAEAREKGGELKAELDKLGIGLTNSAGQAKSTEQLFAEFGDRLTEIQDPSEKLRVAFKFLDTEGVALTQMFQEGGKSLADFGKEAEALGLVMEDSTIQTLQDADATLKQTGRQFKVILASAIKPLSTGLDGMAASFKAGINIISNFSGVLKAGAAAAAAYVVAVKGMRAAIAATTAIQGLSTAVAGSTRLLKALKIALVAASTGNFTKAMKAAAVAVRLLSTALAANPIGLVAAGLTAAVAGFVIFNNKVDEARKKMQQLENQGLVRVKEALKAADAGLNATRQEIIELQKELDRLNGKDVDFADFSLDEQLKMSVEEGKKLQQEIDGFSNGLKTAKQEAEAELEVQKQILTKLEEAGEQTLEIKNQREDIKASEQAILDIDKQILQKQIDLKNNANQQADIAGQIKDKEDARAAGLEDIFSTMSDQELSLKRQTEEINAFKDGGKEALEQVRKRHDFEDKIKTLLEGGNMTVEEAIKLAQDREKAEDALNDINIKIKDNTDQTLRNVQGISNVDLKTKLVAENKLFKEQRDLAQDQLDILNARANGQDDLANKMQAEIDVKNQIQKVAKEQGINEKDAADQVGKRNRLEAKIKHKKVEQKKQQVENDAVAKQAIRDIGDAVDKNDKKRIQAAQKIERIDKRIKELQEKGSSMADREIEKLNSIKYREMELVLDDATKEDLENLKKEESEIIDTFNTQKEALNKHLADIRQAEQDVQAAEQDAKEATRKAGEEVVQKIGDANADAIEQQSDAGKALIDGIDTAKDAETKAIEEAGAAVVDAIKSIDMSGGGGGDADSGSGGSGGDGSDGEFDAEQLEQMQNKLMENLNGFADDLGSKLANMKVEATMPDTPYKITNDITINFDSDDIATETTLQSVADILDGKFVNQ